MAYSDSFPATRPVFQADFANGGRVDPRISYSRSTTGTYFGTEKVLSSENLLTYSNPNNAAWNESNGATVSTNAAAAPDGTTTASSIVEDSANSQHRTFISVNATSGQTYTLVAYLKANGRTIAQVATSGASAAANVEFDLSGSGTATTRSGSPANSSISQIGSSGWYKCSFQVTAGSTATLYLNVYLCDSANSNSYTGDGSSGVYAYGFNLSSIGQLVHEDTSGQIAREYQTKLQTAAINAPRFEHSASDSASEGLLVEGSTTNLARYGSAFETWPSAPRVVVTSNCAIAPNGSLAGDLMVTESAAGDHYVYDGSITISSGTAYTASIYAKDAGQRYLQIGGGSTVFGTGQYATFDLQTGSVDANGVTATASSVGNGWYRLTVTATATASATGSFFVAAADSATAARTPSFTGNDYDGLLLWGWQVEASSFASSLVDTGTSSSQLTRASDSASMPISSTGYTGGPVTLLADSTTETDTNNPITIIMYRDGNNQIDLFGKSPNNRSAYIQSGSQYSIITTSSAANGVRAMRVDTNDIATAINGTIDGTDTSQTLPDLTGATVYFGDDSNGGNSIDGHIKRLAIYNEALSDTNLQAITS